VGGKKMPAHFRQLAQITNKTQTTLFCAKYATSNKHKYEEYLLLGYGAV
jgi:hypothetical protein